MKIDAEQTVVVFRKWRTKEGGILALFPHEAWNTSGTQCTCYERVGQHGGADYVGCIARTRPASPDEFAPLKRELEGMGYNLRVMRRR